MERQKLLQSFYVPQLAAAPARDQPPNMHECINKISWRELVKNEIKKKKEVLDSKSL